ncbi:hypothetical protein [Streptomyces sp. URMC 129]|uniref:hypothetical protein n=1 Tax=Streptomyces sp. URMC 129 TaxID=3423407 RepID=UPI003F1B21FA
MSVAHQAASDAVGSAVSALASGLAGALRDGGGGFSLRAFADAAGEPAGALGAVRGLGADALAPFLLAGCPFTTADAAVVRAAAAAFPAPPPEEEDGALWAARDAALVRVLAALGVEADGWEGLGEARVGSEPEEGPGAGTAGEWPAFSAALAKLAPLALPPVTGPVRRAAADRRLDVGRGLVRAMLRRDHLTAARLARWLALDPRPGTAPGTVPGTVPRAGAGAAPESVPSLGTVLDHIAALASGRPRVLFELAVARRLLTGGNG